MRKVSYKIKVKCFKDRATGHWVIHSKKFDISAYGSTKKEAKEMFLAVVETIIETSKL